MTTQQRHLSLSNADRLKLLDLLVDDDFRDQVVADPIGTMAQHNIQFTQQDLADLPDGVILPSLADLRARRHEFEQEIATNGAAFFIMRYFCRTSDSQD